MTLENYFNIKFGESVKKNVNLANYSWFNLGGNAQFFFKAEEIKQLLDFLKEAKKKKFKNYYFRCGIKYLV